MPGDETLQLPVPLPLKGRGTGMGPVPSSNRGGRRPGAGAPKGNLNGLKNGAYSKQLTALRAALLAMPRTVGLLAQMTGRDRRKMQLLARALHYYADLLLAIANGDSIKGLEDPRLRWLALSPGPIKKLAGSPLPASGPSPDSNQAIKAGLPAGARRLS